MTDLVVLVLVIVWVVVLTPRVVRHFREAGSQSSIDSFHAQLHLLERTGPKLVAPAYRLETATRHDATERSEQVDGPLAASVVALGPAPGWRESVRTRRAAADRRRDRRRRRDVLLTLFAMAVVTGGLGIMHDLHLLWMITGVSVLAVAGYVALVAYAQMLDADRRAGLPIAAAPLPATPPLPAAPAWSARGPRHVAGGPLPGIAVLSPGAAWAARAGYPGAWDNEDEEELAPRHAAAGAR